VQIHPCSNELPCSFAVSNAGWRQRRCRALHGRRRNPRTKPPPGV